MLKGRRRWNTQLTVERNLLLFFPFCPILGLSKLDDACHIGEGDLLYPVKFELPIQMLISAKKKKKKTLIDHPERVFYKLSVHPLTQ